MAQPKRRWSKARTHSKRSTWKKEQPTYASCPHCHEPVLPHRVCKNCGYYDGKEVKTINPEGKVRESKIGQFFADRYVKEAEMTIGR